MTVEFEFSERTDEASAKKPPAGVEVVTFAGAPIPTKPVTIPANATKVYMRLFTSGHGGARFCDGGSRDGLSCDGGCPGAIALAVVLLVFSFVLIGAINLLEQWSSEFQR